MELSDNITRLLNRWIRGDVAVEDQLLKHIYPLLKNIAHQQLAKVNGQHLNTTMMAHELYFKLKKQNQIEFQNKNHFLALSASLVRRIIIDEIRSMSAAKRGGDIEHVTLDSELVREMTELESAKSINWLTLNHLLNKLNEIDPDSVKLIEWRFFVGLSLQEIADIQGLSISAVNRNWQFAKNWLLNKLQD